MFGRMALLAGLAVVLLGVIGGSGYIVYRQLWAAYHYRKAKEAMARRNLDKARAHLALCLEVRLNSGEAHFLAARTARRAGAYDDAERHLARCKQLGWVPEALALEWALMQAQRGDPATVAADLLRWVEEGHPDSVLILEALARGFRRTFDMDRLEECLDKWLQRDPDSVPALVWRGELLEKRDRWGDAARDYQRAVDLDPENDDARLRLADVLVRDRRAAEALAHFERLAQRQPGHPAVTLGLARCRLELDQAAEAQRLLDDLLATEPGNAAALAERGRVAQRQGNDAEAEAWLRQAVKAAPYEGDILYAFAQCLRRQGKEDEARIVEARLEQVRADLKELRAVFREIATRPRDPSLRLRAGELMLKNGQDAEGLRWLRSALEFAPRHAPTHQALADYFDRLGHKDLATHHRRLAGAIP